MSQTFRALSIASMMQGLLDLPWGAPLYGPTRR